MAYVSPKRETPFRGDFSATPVGVGVCAKLRSSKVSDVRINGVLPRSAKRPCYDLFVIALGAIAHRSFEVRGKSKRSGDYIDLLARRDVGLNCQPVVTIRSRRPYRQKRCKISGLSIVRYTAQFVRNFKASPIAPHRPASLTPNIPPGRSVSTIASRLNTATSR